MRFSIKKYIKFAMSIFIAVLAIAMFYQTIYATKVKEVKEGRRTVAVYFVPHADDELLSMAPDIMNRIREGAEVHLVLMSHGEHSVVRDLLNGYADKHSYSYPAGTKVYCKLHQRYHDPVKENFYDKDGGIVDTKELGESRVQEFYEVAKILGIPKAQVHVYDVENEHFTEKEVSHIYDTFIKRYPMATFRTMSPWDWHQDHAFLGKMLKKCESEGKVNPSATVYFLSIYKARFTQYDLPVKEYKGTFLNKDDKNTVKKAIEVYKRWDPVHRWYGNGIHSVPTQFKKLEDEMYINYHY